jgi:hypothetical protein
VRTIQDLKKEIDHHRVGDTAELTIARDRMSGTVEVRIEGSP